MCAEGAMCKKCDAIDSVMVRAIEGVPRTVAMAIVALAEAKSIPAAVVAATGFSKIEPNLLHKYFVLHSKCNNIIVRHGLGELSPTPKMESEVAEFLEICQQIDEICGETIRTVAEMPISAAEMN